jgi:hypothetical protein
MGAMEVSWALSLYVSAHAACRSWRADLRFGNSGPDT